MSVLRSRLRQALVPGAALLALAALAGTATAQVTPEQQSAIRGNCRSDFMSKCSGVTPGGKDALMCLQKNVASLSPGCKTAVSATMPAPAKPTEAKPAEAKPAEPKPAQAPAAPAAAPAPAAAATPAATPAPAPATPAPATTAKPQRAQTPAAAKPQQPRPATPPKQAVVTPPAAAATTAAPAAPAPTAQQTSAIKFTCRREFARFCKGVAPGGAEAVACLQGNAAKLSADCKTSLADLGDAPAAAGPVVPPRPAGTPKAPVVMTAVIGRSCVRDLVKHCRDTGIGEGQKIACLQAHADSLTVMCRAAMKITTPLQR